MDSTSESLLLRLRQPDSEVAWDRFIRLYYPLLHHWATRAGLQPADAADLVQDVLVTLLAKMSEFQYDGRRSFRGWLRTVTLNHWRDRLKRRATKPMPGHAERLDNLANDGEISKLIDREYQQAVAARALQLMRDEFNPKIWKACWEQVVNGRPAADIARELGTTPGAVYAATARVLARLRQELDGLMD